VQLAVLELPVLLEQLEESVVLGEQAPLVQQEAAEIPDLLVELVQLDYREILEPQVHKDLQEPEEELDQPE